MGNDELFNWLRKTDNMKGPWKRVGPKIPPKRQVPGNRRVKTNKKDCESAVQKEIIMLAGRLGIHLWRQQAGRIFTGQYTIVLAPKGCADLTGILPNGVRLEVECKKRYGGIQSDDQKKWQEFIEENNGVYILARSGDEFKDKVTPILKELL